MNGRPIESAYAPHPHPGHEGRMTEQDTRAFRTLLARLEESLAADRRAAARTPVTARSDG